MRKTTSVLAISVLLGMTGAVAAAPETAPEQLSVAMYAPAAAFADSSARIAYVQGLAKTIQQKTGISTTGKMYVRLGDLLGAKPDFAIIDGQCLASKSPGPILATAVVAGDTSQSWALYTRGETLPMLRGKRIVVAKTGCRDADFLDNAMLDGEVKTATYFAAIIDKPDVTGAVLAVRDYKAADAVFAPAVSARGLTKIYDAGAVPNAGFVALRQYGEPLVNQVKDAVLGYGGGGGFDGWRAAAQVSYTALGVRMGGRVKRPVFAAPDPVRLDDQAVLIVPHSTYAEAPIRQHFWEPSPGVE